MKFSNKLIICFSYLYMNTAFCISLQKRHNADNVVNKKECQGIENDTFLSV